MVTRGRGLGAGLEGRWSEGASYKTNKEGCDVQNNDHS